MQNSKCYTNLNSNHWWNWLGKEYFYSGCGKNGQDENNQKEKEEEINCI